MFVTESLDIYFVDSEVRQEWQEGPGLDPVRRDPSGWNWAPVVTKSRESGLFVPGASKKCRLWENACGHAGKGAERSPRSTRVPGHWSDPKDERNTQQHTAPAVGSQLAMRTCRFPGQHRTSSRAPATEDQGRRPCSLQLRWTGYVNAWVSVMTLYSAPSTGTTILTSPAGFSHPPPNSAGMVPSSRSALVVIN